MILSVACQASSISKWANLASNKLFDVKRFLFEGVFDEGRIWPLHRRGYLVQLASFFIFMCAVWAAPVLFYHLQVWIVYFATQLRILSFKEDIHRVFMMRGHIGRTMLASMILSVLTGEVIQELEVFRRTAIWVPSTILVVWNKRLQCKSSSRHQVDLALKRFLLSCCLLKVRVRHGWVRLSKSWSFFV